MFLPSSKNSTGFFLLDILIGFTIVGIIFGLMIPKYNSYKLRALETEAKTNLSTIFKYERIYYDQYQAASNNLLRIGFIPDGKQLFNCGFAGLKEKKGKLDRVRYAFHPNTFDTKYCGSKFAPKCQWNSRYINHPVAFTNPEIGQASGPSTSLKFVAGCIGAVGAAKYPIWTIKETGILLNPVKAN